MNKKFIGGIFAGFLLAVLLVSGGVYVDAQSKRAAKSMTSDQAISCINTAVKAQAGRITNLDIEMKGGKMVCEVEIITEEGKEYDVDIDANANILIQVKEDR